MYTHAKTKRCRRIKIKPEEITSNLFYISTFFTSKQNNTMPVVIHVNKDTIRFQVQSTRFLWHHHILQQKSSIFNNCVNKSCFTLYVVMTGNYNASPSSVIASSMRIFGKTFQTRWLLTLVRIAF